MSTNLGNRLKSLREEFGFLQRDMAVKLDMSTSGYGFYETGRRTPDAIMIKKLCNIFDVDADYLLGRTDVRKAREEEIYNNAFHSISTDGLSKEDIDMIQTMVKRLRDNHNNNN